MLDVFRLGRLPADAATLVDRVFGPAGDRGSLVITGANGIVGAGKAMQLGSRLEPFGVRVVALDFPGSPDGLGRHYAGLAPGVRPEGADRIMANIVRLTYDGKRLAGRAQRASSRASCSSDSRGARASRPRTTACSATRSPASRSVPSPPGSPSRELGVGIAHPAFPHEINKVWEVVEPTPSAVTQMLWALGLVPMPVSDDWSFVLDVLFCGVTLAGLKTHRATNMPFWKIDKLTRRLIGANPFRAHDAIGSKGADFLTWA